jgi:hypothetical protein
MQRVDFKVEKTNTGFYAQTSELPITTTGETLSGLLENILDAANDYYEEQGQNRRLDESDVLLNITIYKD